MTLASVAAGCLLVGWLAGRRSFRRQLQTSEGRQRAGWYRDQIDEYDDWEDEVAEWAAEIDEPETAPIFTGPDRVRTRELRVVR